MYHRKWRGGRGAPLKSSTSSIDVHEGLLPPEGIRRIRKKLHLTQEAAGLIIGGGPRAFQKYEKGDLLPSWAISNALILLDRDPEALLVLKVHGKAA
ncbi:type II TA system antitoxin MqsA family protein [Geomonas subterranea]|uniref:type II TA system antitoxin MqsA family protein n=1 Tax=Geomonas subterranea TaxID=2847989 RepID=UPI001CD54ED9|nr:type II TA system antitoxin MqsA family protein [Geomonas fuzhouensis]